VPLDTRIPLMAQTYQPDFGEIAQTRAQGMNVLSQMRQRDQELAQQNALAEYVKRGGLTQDPMGALQFGAAGADMLNASTQANRFKLEQDKATREAEQERLETQKKAFGTALMNVYADPSDANADMNFANLEVLGIDTSPYRQMLSQVKDPVERKNYLDDFINTTEEGRTFLGLYQSKPEMVDVGNRKIMVEKNPNRDDFGKEISGFNVGVSPDQQSRENIAAADRAARLDIASANRAAAAAPAAATQQGAVDEKRALAQQNAVKYTETAMDAVNQALPLVGAAESGILGAASSMIPGTPAYSLKNNYYSTIKSALSLERLAEIRQASPTGGALGNVSNQENKLLGDSIAALDVGLSEKEQERNLRKIYSALENINLINSGKTPIPRVKTDADAEKVPSGAVFYDPDFVKRVMP